MSKRIYFLPQNENEEFPSPKVQYVIAIVALMYLANNTRPNITFVVS